MKEGRKERKVLTARLTALVFHTEVAPTVLIFGAEIILTVLMFLTEIASTLLIFGAEIHSYCTDVSY